MKIDSTLERFGRLLFSQATRINGTRKQEFRASSLPICPVRWVMNHHTYNGQLPSEESIGLDFFAGIGTTVHTALQKWGGYHALLYGDWELKTTEKKKIEGKTYYRTKVNVVKNRVGPLYHKQGVVIETDEIPTDAELAVYKELLVKHPATGLTGHVDGLIPFKDGFIVLDFKTTSVKKIAEMEEPPIEYHHQIHTYWHLLETYGPWDDQQERFRKPLKIYGSVLFMVTRDNPFDKETGFRMFVSEENDLTAVNQNFANKLRAEKAIRTGDYKDVVKHRLCRCVEDTEGCEYSVLGCAVNKEKLLKNIEEAHGSE